jgi:adenosylcobyric acid synthase
MSHSLMVVGTSSHVGKSLVVTAICRLLARRGYRVAPFKAQNMSLNAYVTEDGSEIAYAQALQAWAAQVLPQVEMNPILLKPLGNFTSQVILNGKVVGTYAAADYYAQVFEPGWQAVTTALATLGQEFDWIVAEGAGSPAEVNLHHRDLTNLRVAEHLGSPVWLVADIDRGGALAHVVGTLQVLPPHERRLIQGIIINKFRGSLDLLQPGLDWLERTTGIPIVGVLPWLDFALPAEDSLSLLETRSRRGGEEIEIAVIWLPRIANFTDFDPLLAEPSVRVRFVKPGEPLGCPDAVIVPGSKSTIADLQSLQQAGMVQQLHQFAGVVVGICGGLQMLGTQIADPEGLEGSPSTCAGLGFLAAETRLDRAKITQQRSTEACWPVVTEIQGYEIHQGVTQFGPGVAPLLADPDLGAVAEGGRVWGSYLHGIFENHAFRRHWLNDLRQRKGIPPLPLLSGHFAVEREALLDRLATTWDPHLNLESLGI